MTVLMRKDPSISVVLVNLAEIDSSDRVYAVTPGWFPVETLKRSVQSIGIRVPLWLERTDGPRLRLVSGFRRFKVAQQLEIDEIPAIITPAQECRETFIDVLWENLGFRPLTDTEKAIVLRKLIRKFSFTEAQLLQDILPILKLRADRYHLERYLKIAELPDLLQEAMMLGRLSVDTALELSRWEDEEQLFLVELIRKYQLGRNKQKELVQILGDLKSIKKMEVVGVWEKSGASEIEKHPGLSPQDRLAGIRTALRRLRYPQLTHHEKRYRELKNSLKLPRGLRLSVPNYFEGSEVSVTMSAKSARELRDLVKESQCLFEQEGLDQIFELL